MATQPPTDVPAAYPEGAACSPLPFLSRLLTEMIRTGRLTVIDAAGRVHPFGPGDSGPDVSVRIHDPLLPMRILLRPSLALGEAYMDGTITIEQAIYDERFCRMWEFYLAVCEAAFRNGPMMVFQLQLARRRDAVPLTRDYIADRERRDVRAEDVAA